MKTNLKAIINDDTPLDRKSMEEITGRSFKKQKLNPPVFEVERIEPEKPNLIRFLIKKV